MALTALTCTQDVLICHLCVDSWLHLSWLLTLPCCMPTGSGDGELSPQGAVPAEWGTVWYRSGDVQPRPRGDPTHQHHQPSQWVLQASCCQHHVHTLMNLGQKLYGVTSVHYKSLGPKFHLLVAGGTGLEMAKIISVFITGVSSVLSAT